MANLRLVRAYFRWSQKRLGKLLGMDRRRISEIENGDRGFTEPQLSRLRCLLKSLNAQGLLDALAVDLPAAGSQPDSINASHAPGNDGRP